MNLQGKIVKVHVPENEQISNNSQATAPAIVVNDWGPEENEMNAKALNLRLIQDGMDTPWLTSVMHVEVSNEPLINYAWELYE